MMAYKDIFGLAVMLIINTIPINGAFAPYYSANKSHDLRVGYRLPGDRLVLSENITRNSNWMKIQIVEKTFNVKNKLTMIEVLDQETSGKGGYASIIQGGPGNDFVTLKLTSQRSHGLNFIVKLYERL